VWDRLPPEPRNQLSQIIAFHHPDFNPAMSKSFPDIEQLLTEIEINIQFFDSSRPAEGRFAEAQLRETRKVLLSSVEAWFHDLYKDALEPEWLHRMVAKMQSQNAAIVSFNWDLVLDHTLFGGALNKEKYSLSKQLGKGPILLKPHGSLNWYKGSNWTRSPTLRRPRSSIARMNRGACMPSSIPATSARKAEKNTRHSSYRPLSSKTLDPRYSNVFGKTAPRFSAHQSGLFS
jgi:hypothetical protein